MHLPGPLSLLLQAGGAPADLTWLAYIDIWIISGLVFLAVVVVVGKLIWGRLRRRDDEEYDWYYDDEYVDDEYITDDDSPDDRR